MKLINKNVLTGFAVMSFFLLTACTTVKPHNPSNTVIDDAARSVDSLNNGVYDQQTIAPSPIPQARPSSSVPSNSVSTQNINAGDVLNINVFKVPDLSISGLKVASDGTISMPLVGRVKVAGLSVPQAEQQITQRLKQFMQSPQVSINRTQSTIENRVTLEGEVKRPGLFPIKGSMSFLQAIALGQGLTEIADSRNIYFFRDGQRYTLNLDLVRNGSISDPVLQGDDRIVVVPDLVKVNEKRQREAR